MHPNWNELWGVYYTYFFLDFVKISWIKRIHLRMFYLLYIFIENQLTINKNIWLNLYITFRLADNQITSKNLQTMLTKFFYKSQYIYINFTNHNLLIY